MRALLVIAILGGCGGGSPIHGTRTGVMPLLSELPGDATKRDAVLDSAGTHAGAEHRKGMSSKARKVETAAATAAAILGGMFSSSGSVTVGAAADFDENELFAPAPERAKPGAAKPEAAPVDAPSNADLIPWIKLK